jgi:uncharacterized protein YjiS (DUF1127 family)
MNTRNANQEIGLLFSNSPTIHPTMGSEGADAAEAAMRQARFEAPKPSLLGYISAALAWIADLPRRRAVLDELSTLTDRELADIGLTRAELRHVFDQNFAARHASTSTGAAARRSVRAINA